MYLLGEVSRCALGASTGGPRLDIFYAYSSVRNAQSGGSNESEEPKLLFTLIGDGINRTVLLGNPGTQWRMYPREVVLHSTLLSVAFIWRGEYQGRKWEL